MKQRHRCGQFHKILNKFRQSFCIYEYLLLQRKIDHCVCYFNVKINVSVGISSNLNWISANECARITGGLVSFSRKLLDELFAEVSQSYCTRFLLVVDLISN